jgi:hypothetical protein
MAGLLFIHFEYLRRNNQYVKKLFDRIRNWEAWPFKLIYAPITPVWGWYMLKSRSVWFFTPSNPKITFGGMDGEPKKEMYDLLPKELYPTTFNVLPQQDFESVKAALRDSGLKYPFIVKPEVGAQGILFRKIDREDELLNYHSKVPVEYIVQELVNYPMEVSVFYIRHPQHQKGMVTGFLHKIPLQVVGDGLHTLEQLVQQHPKGNKRIGEMYSKHKDNWHVQIPKGEKYMLSYAANHNRGAHFIDLKAHIDEKLVAIFDRISHNVNDFFYGRYDIMCTNIDDLKNGNNFTILEYNGCGAEPNHFYDTGYTLLGAYKEILKHWKALYEICKYNSAQGVKPWPFQKGRRFLAHIKSHFKMIREADERI